MDKTSCFLLALFDFLVLRAAELARSANVHVAFKHCFIVLYCGKETRGCLCYDKPETSVCKGRKLFGK